MPLHCKVMLTDIPISLSDPIPAFIPGFENKVRTVMFQQVTIPPFSPPTTYIPAHQTTLLHIPGQAEALCTSPVCDSGNLLLTQFSLVLQYFTLLHVFLTES